MDIETANALTTFTTGYCDAWHEKQGTWPQSADLYGVPSPCIISSLDDYVIWQPKPNNGEQNVNAVERAMDIVVQPAVHAFYARQFAGAMTARVADMTLTLLQTWSEDDLQRVQENLNGHLVTQKRLKLSPTLFIATLDSELDVISVCNLSGEVIKETIGTRNRETLAPSLADFRTRLEPLL